MTSRIPFPDKMCRKKIREREREREASVNVLRSRGLPASIKSIPSERERAFFRPFLAVSGIPGSCRARTLTLTSGRAVCQGNRRLTKDDFGKEKKTTNRQSGTECRLLCVIQVFSSVSIEKKSGL